MVVAGRRLRRAQPDTNGTAVTYPAQPGQPTEVDLAARAAYNGAVRQGIAQIAGALQETLGQSLTALIADVHNTSAIGKWARGQRVPHPQAEQRLRHAYQITQLLRQVETPGTIRAWFLGLNPHLDDTPPALALRDNPAAVLKAARAFAAHG